MGMGLPDFNNPRIKHWFKYLAAPIPKGFFISCHADQIRWLKANQIPGSPPPPPKPDKKAGKTKKTKKEKP